MAGMRRARHLLKGDVLEVVLLDNGRPQLLVVGHELSERDAQRRSHVQPEPVRQLGPQLHIKQSRPHADTILHFSTKLTNGNQL